MKTRDNLSRPHETAVIFSYSWCYFNLSLPVSFNPVVVQNSCSYSGTEMPGLVQIQEEKYEHISVQSHLWYIPFLPCFISSTVVLLLSPFLQKEQCRVKGSWSLLPPSHNMVVGLLSLGPPDCSSYGKPRQIFAQAIQSKNLQQIYNLCLSELWVNQSLPSFAYMQATVFYYFKKPLEAPSQILSTDNLKWGLNGNLFIPQKVKLVYGWYCKNSTSF